LLSFVNEAVKMVVVMVMVLVKVMAMAMKAADDSRQQTADSRQQAVDSRQLTANSKQAYRADHPVLYPTPDWDSSHPGEKGEVRGGRGRGESRSTRTPP
jgi:hypothetical protein